MDSSFYQLILLGDIANPSCGIIRSRFFELLKDRGLDTSLVAVLEGKDVLAAPGTGGYESSKPSFAFYFGKIGHGDKDLPAVEKLMGNADAIFPIHFQAGRFQEEVPEKLWPVNGRLYDAGEIDSIVNVALEELRLLRKTRRVFISYKRENAPFVTRLYEELERHDISAWIDLSKLHKEVGEEYQEKIRKAIDSAEYFLLI